MRGRETAALQARLGYQFSDTELLATALTHKSYANENAASGATDNERLEFLGDAVIDLVIGELLMERYPDLREGELSMMRAQIVSEAGLAVIAREISLGDYLYLGKGESQTGGADKLSLLSDACEAVIAAVYLDGGFEAARTVVLGLFEPHVGRTALPGAADFKTRLQERVQAIHKEPPRYEVVEEVGPDHDKTFTVAVTVQDRELARADGKSKKEAEQRAAEVALEQMPS